MKALCIAGLTVLLTLVVGLVTGIAVMNWPCAFFACLPDQQYHKASISPVTMLVERNGWDIQRKTSKENYAPITFDKAWLEIRDSGELHDRSQLSAILARLTELANKGPVLVVTFMNGFHHNSDDHSVNKKETEEELVVRLNAVKFDYFVARQADQVRRLHEQRQQFDDVPQVLGIYVGWRGKLLADDMLNNLVIGNRAAIADTIAQGPQSGLRESLLAIAEKLNGFGGKSKLLVTGHSLGGRATWMALRKDLISSGKPPLGENALVALLEPAISADCFDETFSSRNTLKRPFIVSITSVDDEALSGAYSAAATVPNIMGGVPSCKYGWTSSHETIGNYDNYLTHKLYFENLTNGDYVDLDNWKQRANERNVALFPTAGEDAQWSGNEEKRIIAYAQRNPRCSKAAQNCYSQKSVDIYKARFERVGHVQTGGAVWNIVTDRDTIDSSTLLSFKASRRHNFISTNLARLFAEMLYANP